MSNTVNGIIDDFYELIDNAEHHYMLCIQNFHRKFQLPSSPTPRQLDQDLASFRIGFMEEELVEYIRAHNQDDLEGQLDALVDLVYVALGTAHMQGFDFHEAWNRVHQANMTKVRAADAEDSKRGSPYDVVKPEGWTPPDLSDLVK